MDLGASFEVSTSAIRHLLISTDTFEFESSTIVTRNYMIIETQKKYEVEFAGCGKEVWYILKRFVFKLISGHSDHWLISSIDHKTLIP